MPWNPLQLSKLDHWATVASLASLANNDPADEWGDGSGNLNDFKQTTAGAKPTFKTNILNGSPGVYFDGGDKLPLADGAYGGGYAPLSFACAVQAQGSPGFWAFFQAGGTIVGTWDSTTLIIYNGGTWYFVTVPSTTVPLIIVGTVDGANTVVNVNGTDYPGTTAATSGSLTTLGDFGGGPLQGYIFEYLDASGYTWTSGEKSDLLAYMNAQWGSGGSGAQAEPSTWPRASQWQVVCEGDSNTHGSGITDGEDWPSVLTRNRWGWLITPAMYYGNKAISGSTIADVSSRATNDDKLIRTHKRNIYIAMIGTNDYYLSGHSAATAEADLATLCAARQAAGWEVWVMTIVPRSNDAAYLTFRNAYNALIQANWTGYADGLIDLAADPNIGADASSADPTYYQVDQLHLNAAGHAYVATQLVGPALGDQSFSPARACRANQILGGLAA